MMKSRIIIAILLIVNIQLNAVINDECYYIKPAEMGEKCLAGREGSSWGRYIYSDIIKQYPINFMDYMFTDMTQERYIQECKSSSTWSSKGIKSEHRDYYILNCMEVLYDVRKTIKKIRRRGY